MTTSLQNSRSSIYVPPRVESGAIFYHWLPMWWMGARLSPHTNVIISGRRLVEQATVLASFPKSQHIELTSSIEDFSKSVTICRIDEENAEVELKVNGLA